MHTCFPQPKEVGYEFCIKRWIRPMSGFKSFRWTQTLLAGIELIHMLYKGQYKDSQGNELLVAEQQDVEAEKQAAQFLLTDCQ